MVPQTVNKDSSIKKLFQTEIDGELREVAITNEGSLVEVYNIHKNEAESLVGFEVCVLMHPSKILNLPIGSSSTLGKLEEEGYFQTALGITENSIITRIDTVKVPNVPMGVFCAGKGDSLIGTVEVCLEERVLQ